MDIKLLIIRHAEGEHQLGNTITGYKDLDHSANTAKLTEKGIKQAQKAGLILGQYLKKNPNHKRLVCFSSTMKRAIQTLNEVIQESDFYDFERFEDSRLCEVSHSYMDWIGRNKYSELVEPHCLRDLWKRDPYHTRTLSGTCPADIEIALRGFLSDLNSVYQEGCLPVIVSHGRTLLILEALLENKINRAGTYTGDKPTGMQNAEIRELRVDRLIFPQNYSSIKLLDQD